MTAELAAHRQLGMADDEYDAVCSILGREPRPAELAMYSVMWSEHCSYKSSRPHLGRLPSEAPWVVVGPGENAGVVDLGDGWLAALRIESHNHPSYVEPYQGAATGVGGILRDIFTMGARPIAVWDALRFGDLDDAHNRYLLSGVVSGIAGYGNAVGVPTVGGELEFAAPYAKNPLVNVMALGVMRRDQLVLARAERAGDVAVLLGAATGRDGIGGASILASASFDEQAKTKRPTVQIGDPFEEKKLIEACLDLVERGLVVGMQDLGAAGISCATSECAGSGGMGMEVDLDAVPLREDDMSPGEILMSESQERMLAIVAEGDVDEVLAVAAKWEIAATVIGVVTADPMLRVHHGGELVAELPAASLAGEAPVMQRPLQRPSHLDELHRSQPEPPQEIDMGETLLALLGDPALADPSWIYEQYDHQLFLNTIRGPGGDGALLRLKGTDKGLAVSVDGHGHRCHLDPRVGAERLVYEAALNVAVAGAWPLAVVDNLNFGNPEKPEVMWQLSEAIDGIAAGCETLRVPVIGGNVSFYNETDGVDVLPTPVIGMLGLTDPMPASPPALGRAADGMEIWELGAPVGDDLAASAFDRVVRDHHGGIPAPPDADLARAVVALAVRLAHRGVPVLHDVGVGGTAVAVAEICMESGRGARLVAADWQSWVSESPLRFVAVVPDGFGLEPVTEGVPARRIGVIGGATLDFGPLGSVTVERAADVWRKGLARKIG